MDAFNDPKISVIVGIFSAQMGKTTVIENVVGYHLQHDPSPVMWVEPTLEIAEAMSKDRFSPMLRDTPSLKRLFGPGGTRTSGDTLLHKKFPGGSLTFAGANSYNSLASRPIRIAIGDEAAKWEPNAKGSPMLQLIARVKGFWNSKVAFFSTPTSSGPENEFWQLWETSDQRLFFAQCECGGPVVFTFDELPDSLPAGVDVHRAVLRWTEGAPITTADGNKIRQPADAWFECSACRRRIDDVERAHMVRSGEWHATKLFNGTAGFWGWQALSPFKSAAAIEIAREWLGALGNPATLQSRKNETLGLPWKEKGATQDWKRLFDRRDLSYSLGTVPRGALILTAGADVQADRIEIQVIGWGRRRQCWVVDYIILYGDISRHEVWDDLTKILGNVYRNEIGAEFTISRLAVDSGHEANRVYEWARLHRFGPVSVIKGGPDSQLELVRAPSAVEINHHGQRIDVGVKVQLINVGEFKKELYGRLSLDLPNLEKGEEYPEGFFHICALQDTEEYCRQLTAEQLVTRNSKGVQRREWEKIRPRNEALDTWNYAAAGRVIHGIDRYGDFQWSQLDDAANRPPNDSAPPAQRPKFQIRLGGF